MTFRLPINKLTGQPQINHIDPIRIRWDTIPFCIIPQKMTLADRRPITPDNMKADLRKAAEILLEAAIQKKHMLGHLHRALHDDKEGMEAGTQKCFTNTLTTAITNALTDALKEKLSTSGKKIVLVGASSLAFVGLIGASVALAMSSLGHIAVGWIGLLLAACFLGAIVAAWTGCMETTDSVKWARKLFSDKPSEAMEAKVLNKVATAISTATNEFKIPESHREQFTITKTDIEKEMKQWRSWESPTINPPTPFDGNRWLLANSWQSRDPYAGALPFGGVSGSTIPDWPL